MSTDTMYFNSSRLMSASSKNKTNSVPRLDKKRIQSERKNKVRQETIDISLPEPQVLPNGEKPDFGNSKSGRKQRQDSYSARKQKNTTTGSNKCVQEDKSDHTAKVTQDLKDLFLKGEGERPRTCNKKRNEKKQNGLGKTPQEAVRDVCKAKADPASNLVRPVSTPVSDSFSHSKHDISSSAISPTKFPDNPSLSPSFINQNSYPILPSSSPVVQPQYQQNHHLHQQPMGFAGYPYGNYALTPPPNTPQFMAPQAPLMNPMYPQPPLNQLPMMYRALDIQQRQMEQQYNLHQMQNHQYQPPPPLPPPVQQQKPYSRPLSAPYGMIEVPKLTEPTAVIGRSKPLENRTTGTSTSFAGASFASKDPKVHKLPKPSFA